MAIVTNFDDLNQLHKNALVKGAGSKAWIEFASTMMDSFPHLYAKAKSMNSRLDELQKAIDSLKTK